MGSGASTGGQPSPILDFYLGTSPNAEGRRIEDIWDWDDGRLEGVHNFIQWLFPLRTRSAFNARAPVLSEAEIERFRESELLRQRLARSLDTMLRSTGCSCDAPLRVIRWWRSARRSRRVGSRG